MLTRDGKVMKLMTNITSLEITGISEQFLDDLETLGIEDPALGKSMATFQLREFKGRAQMLEELGSNPVNIYVHDRYAETKETMRYQVRLDNSRPGEIISRVYLNPKIFLDGKTHDWWEIAVEDFQFLDYVEG